MKRFLRRRGWLFRREFVWGQFGCNKISWTTFWMEDNSHGEIFQRRKFFGKQFKRGQFPEGLFPWGKLPRGNLLEGNSSGGNYARGKSSRRQSFGGSSPAYDCRVTGGSFNLNGDLSKMLISKEICFQYI